MLLRTCLICQVINHNRRQGAQAERPNKDLSLGVQVAGLGGVSGQIDAG